MTVADNIKFIKERLEKAAKAHGFEAPQLIAVSKMQPPESIREALGAGQRVFGENRVQEAQAHWDGLKREFPDVELHLIGPLQTNKVKDAVALFDVIQSVDREKLAAALGEEMKKQGRDLPCFIQVNTGGEQQKAGIAPGALPALLKFCRADCGLKIEGLMCIPPLAAPAGVHFAFLKNLARENGLQKLSMGMSADYETAAQLGAAYVRVGSAVFGARE